MDNEWLPDLVLLSDYDASYYLDAVYQAFCLDFIKSQPKFKHLWVRCRRNPIVDGKEAGFWHCISEGKNEDERLPDTRRCERIKWPRAVIERAMMTPSINCWTNERQVGRGKRTRHLLWYAEEYLVVLEEKMRNSDGFQYFVLVTAYCTEQEHRKRKLRQERDG